MRADFLIIGQGLAGTCLAWRLQERGRTYLIVDRGEPVTSSKIAAGLVTPITGMRLNLNWRYDALHPEAVAFYQEKERLLNRRFYHFKPHVRLFKKPEEVELWKKREQDERLMAYVMKDVAEPLVDEAVIANPLGGFEQRHSGYLDAADFLAASREHFMRLGVMVAGEVRADDVRPDDGCVIWRGERFGQVVFCQGWEAALHPWFDWVPFQSARGTVLSVSAEVKESRIINRGCWLLPRADGTLRVGPTYELRFTDPNTPGELAMTDLQSRLAALLKIPHRITDSQTAARPIIRGAKAMIGRHPSMQRVSFLNGLGSKGVLRAPFMARRLVEHLLDHAPLEEEYDLRRNL
jgi:glycine/D-amino acid oxidase-like deaminating enzyme